MLGHVVNGLSFAVLAVIDGAVRRSYPVHVTQIVRSVAKKPVVTTPKCPCGRPYGSRNNPWQDQTRSPELTQIDAQLTQFFHEKLIILYRI